MGFSYLSSGMPSQNLEHELKLQICVLGFAFIDGKWQSLMWKCRGMKRMRQYVVTVAVFVLGCSSSPRAGRIVIPTDDDKSFPVMFGDTYTIDTTQHLTEPASPANNPSVAVELQTLNLITPKYPEIAVRQNKTGQVVLNVLVISSGMVTKALIIKSTDPIFNTSALHALMQWTFMPAFAQGKPVAYWMEIPIRFRLSVNN